MRSVCNGGGGICWDMRTVRDHGENKKEGRSKKHTLTRKRASEK
jgi:hypothetical protein